jgi:hypothetical protein
VSLTGKNGIRYVEFEHVDFEVLLISFWYPPRLPSLVHTYLEQVIIDIYVRVRFELIASETQHDQLHSSLDGL